MSAESGAVGVSRRASGRAPAGGQAVYRGIRRRRCAARSCSFCFVQARGGHLGTCAHTSGRTMLSFRQSKRVRSPRTPSTLFEHHRASRCKTSHRRRATRLSNSSASASPRTRPRHARRGRSEVRNESSSSSHVRNVLKRAVDAADGASRRSLVSLAELQHGDAREELWYRTQDRIRRSSHRRGVGQEASFRGAPRGCCRGKTSRASIAWTRDALTICVASDGACPVQPFYRESVMRCSARACAGSARAFFVSSYINAA